MKVSEENRTRFKYSEIFKNFSFNGIFIYLSLRSLIKLLSGSAFYP